MPTLVPTMIAPSGFLQGQEKSTDPSAGNPEQGPTTGLVRVRLPAAGVSSTLVSSSSSSEKLDYSGDDIDWDDMCPASDTSKFSLLTKEEMQVVARRRNCHLEGSLPLRVFFLPYSILFLSIT